MYGEKWASAQKGKESRDVGRKMKNAENGMKEKKEKKEEIGTAVGEHGGRWNEICRK